MAKDTDFTVLTGHETLARLADLPMRKRRDTARRLIYKKNQRPAGLDEQIILLDALRSEPALAEIDRIYALIAGGHKVCEEVMVAEAEHWLDRFLEAEAKIRAMPIVFGLRKDRTHLVFSALNVALNLDLLTGSRHAERLAAWFREEVEGLQLRRMTPYLFNSSSNTVKCAGIVLLSNPEDIARIADLMRKLLSYGIEINNPLHWWIFSRFKAPERLEDVTERAAFTSFRNSVHRLSAIEAAAAGTGPEDRRAALHRVAELCVAQATPPQKAALMAQAGTRLAALG